MRHGRVADAAHAWRASRYRPRVPPGVAPPFTRRSPSGIPVTSPASAPWTTTRGSRSGDETSTDPARGRPLPSAARTSRITGHPSGVRATV